MPFKDTRRMESRIALFTDYDTGAFPFAELCHRHDISRQSFYFWKERRDSGDPEWFKDRSHAVTNCPHATNITIAERIVAVRRKFEHFGPKKILAVLEREAPEVAWPALSTIGDILKRAGLVEPRRRARRPVPVAGLVPEAVAPNDEWAIDFKGWYRTLDGRRCDPLTITDTLSRYLIAIDITEPTTSGVRPILERVFAEYGLPAAMRSDNGQPLGSHGCGGLSVLAVWLLKLGIEPHYIPPASPQHNGRHERMHRTLSEHTSRPAAEDRSVLQQRFDGFRAHYNNERPHEALDQQPPCSRWQASARPLPRQLQEPWYDADHQTIRIRSDGAVRWQGQAVFVSESLIGETVGLAEFDGGGHMVRFFHRELGVIDREGRFRAFAPPRARLRSAPKPALAEKVMTAEH
jgi:transposase InsO family protein